MMQQPYFMPAGQGGIIPIIDRIAGHTVTLDLLYLPWADQDLGCVGAFLHAGDTRIWLDADHAENLAERVRSAVDQAVLGVLRCELNQRRTVS